MKVSIVVPVYNECETLHEALARVEAVDFDKEIVIVDDGSTDGSTNLVKEYEGCPGYVVKVHESNRGKGAALRTGFEVASGEVITIHDADLEYNPQDLALLVKRVLQDEADVVYGSRMTGRNPVGYWYMYAGNQLVSFAARVLYGKGLTDIETCYKVFKRSMLPELRLVSDGFDIEAEFSAKVLRGKYRIRELPISYDPRHWGEGKKISWRDGVRAIWILMYYKIKK